MTATTIEAARIAGALKCMDALRKLDHDATHATEWGGPEQSAAEYYAQRLADVRALVAAHGPMSPELEGAIATLAEYIHSEICGVVPDVSPGHWIPLSAMTDDERQATVARIESENTAIDAERASRRKVISMAERRAAS
jgi:hypothetical protein